MKKTIILLLCSTPILAQSQTTITKWKDEKQGAVSITYDDGNRNQFRYMLPIMDKMRMPATFYIITGPIAGSQYPTKFIGRPVEEIINETAATPTNADNYFERASAAKYLNRIGADVMYDRSAIKFERGKFEDAYKILDSLYAKTRDGSLQTGAELSDEVSQEVGLSWDSVKQYASRGFEFASHTVSHTHLAVLDSANVEYELYKSKEEIKNHLGADYTFDAEIPFGIEHPRALHFGFPAYEALRNMMKDSFLFEINRGYKTQPGSSNKEYVQWQRGPLSKTSLQEMKSYVDTTLAHTNIWLVLVFHGINGLGWEALPDSTISRYFQYIRKNENKLWVATFRDVGRYMRERMNAKVSEKKSGKNITVQISQSLAADIYNFPLTVKTYVPAAWKKLRIEQAGQELRWQIKKDAKGSYVLYDALPGDTPVQLSVL